jgi:soluble lytic murein transglycosylase-like protein
MGSSNETYFNNAGHEFDINPIFLAAIANKESQFRTDALSPKGAYGIMQIMPKTASDIWNDNKNIIRPKECSGEDDPASGTYTLTCKNWMKSNPQEVIRMGAAYFQTINNQLYKCGFNGNTTLMAAGYNAGPYRRDICGGELPPISETQDYVRKVNSYSSAFCKNSGGTVEKIDTTPPGLEPAPER